MKNWVFIGVILGGFFLGPGKHIQVYGQDSPKPPNVILVMTDDQGIGDLSCHGNPWLKTPELDKFYEEAVRMTNFHVSPYCTPTRAALMTGRYPLHNGAWATYKGRDALFGNAMTLADVFQQNGYRTGLFGKWHLGDNYPVRPTDCGFEVAIHHMAGGVGELSDYWGNSYFDDVYRVNNEPKQFTGYCTDVWFEEAIKFMEETKDRPFFVYLPTNAPHSPLIAPETYIAPYRNGEGTDFQSAAFYGMIANVDENFGKLDAYLKQSGLAKNTILIFMTDNGTQYGYNREKNLGHNKGFRGNKGGKLEGAHRVPFFIRWPEANIEGGEDIHELTAHVDIFPTLAGLCKLDVPSQAIYDGVDFSELLRGKKDHLPERTLFIHLRQDWRPPRDIEGSSLMHQDWRLINGNELYDIHKDPQQLRNIARQNPESVEKILAANATFVEAAKRNLEYRELPVHIIGSPAQKEITLTIQHAIGEDKGIWKPEQVAAGMKNTNNTHALEVDQRGTYRISCRRWPKECPGPILGIPTENPKNLYTYESISPEKVRIQIANQLLEKEIQPEEEAVIFEVLLEKGKTFLVTDFIEGKEKYGVYYTYVEYVGEPE